MGEQETVLIIHRDSPWTFISIMLMPYWIMKHFLSIQL